MKMLTLNVCGLGVKGKFGWVKGICSNEKPDIIALQETRCKHFSDHWVHNLWGNNDCGFIQKEVVGKSGGMLMVWDTKSFLASSCLCSEFFLAIIGNWVISGQESIIVNVYGPHNDSSKIRMWNSLDNGKLDRLNCVFKQSRASRFNEFITRNNLVEIPITGRKFTRISDDGAKFSKLDRFLVNDSFIGLWKDLSVNPLDRRVSDHCPLILRDKYIDYGPKPFKIFYEWLNCEGVDEIVNNAWSTLVTSKRLYCIFRDRLKNVKFDLRDWSKRVFGNLDCEINELKIKVDEREKKAEGGCRNNVERETWLGDKNSKFFHASIKRKFNKCNIRGLNITGSWNENLNDVKETIRTHFQKFFESRINERPSIVVWVDDVTVPASSGVPTGHGSNRPNNAPTEIGQCNFPGLFSASGSDPAIVRGSVRPTGPAINHAGPKLLHLSETEANELELPFCEKEIWEAIKDCGGTKAPGPDGFNLSFYKKKILGHNKR
ncbi:uncharacterized protein [Rutidosis leptorrhynchoides]|uniref:uncharacterized protein n=1 Tax=Rutidosis leptorrhynchoides TaxID=125765 RepID=UPI003A9972C8